MTASLTKLLRLASVAICLIVIASFVLFALNQTSNASARQQEAVNSTNGQLGTAAVKHPSAHVGSLRKAIDEASDELTSPFAGITAGSSSQWTIHGANMLLALVVYGFGLGFLARVIRVGR